MRQPGKAAKDRARRAPGITMKRVDFVPMSPRDRDLWDGRSRANRVRHLSTVEQKGSEEHVGRCEMEREKTPRAMGMRPQGWRIS